MRKSRFIRQPFISLIFPLLLISGCGSGGDQGFDANTDSDSETGGVAFSLKWEAPETNLNKPLNRSAPKIACTTLGIETVTVNIFNSTNSLLKGTEFPCSAGQGTVEDIPVQSGVRATVEGKNTQGTLIYRGEKGGINISAGATADAGEIVMAKVSGKWGSLIWGQGSWGE